MDGERERARERRMVVMKGVRREGRRWWEGEQEGGKWLLGDGGGSAMWAGVKYLKLARIQWPPVFHLTPGTPQIKGHAGETKATANMCKKRVPLKTTVNEKASNPIQRR